MDRFIAFLDIPGGDVTHGDCNIISYTHDDNLSPKFKADEPVLKPPYGGKHDHKDQNGSEERQLQRYSKAKRAKKADCPNHVQEK